MELYKEYLQSVVTGYWGESIFRWMFYVGLLAIFFMVKDREKRCVFFWYPLLVYLFMISPVWFFVGSKMWGTGSMGYYFRQFSLIPVFLVIATALALAVKRLPKMIKPVFVLAVCGAIVYCGSPFMYKHPFYGFEKSDNINKIPSDLIAICDYMRSVDEDPVVIMSADLSALVRQYDASIHLMVEAREYQSGLSVAASSDTPDVEYLMGRGCAEGGDFIVVKNLDSVRDNFTNLGYEPCYETSKYLLYACSGYPGVRFIFDEKDNIIETEQY